MFCCLAGQRRDATGHEQPGQIMGAKEPFRCLGREIDANISYR